MRHLASFALISLLAPLAACPGSKPADEGPHCEATESDLALDEASPLGFSAADVLVNLPGHEDATFNYVDGTSTDLDLDFAPAASARFVDLEAVYPEGGVTTDIAVICDDYIAIEVSMGFATADGAFAETLDVELQATAVDDAAIHHELDLDALAGTFDIAPFVTAEDYTELKAWIDVSIGGAVTSGSVSGQASGEDECSGDECTAWAEAVDVGSWGAAAPE